MKTAYNSAYIQTETFNYLCLASMITVHVYLSFNFQEIAMPNAKY